MISASLTRKFTRTAVASMLVAALVAPAISTAALAAPMSVAPVNMSTGGPVTNIGWHRHNNGALAGGLLALGILGVGAAAIASQNQRYAGDDYYNQGYPVYQEPYAAAPVYEDEPVYQPRYNAPVQYNYRHQRCEAYRPICYDKYGNPYHVGPVRE